MSTPTAISIVIPVFNEAHRIGRTLDEVWRYFRDRDAEVLIVDDGSTDSTVEIVRAFARDHTGVRVLAEKHRGKAATVLAGLQVARGTLVGFMDADLATPLETWEQCERAITNGAGVAIASREGIGSVRVAEPWYRHVMGRVFNGLVRMLLLPGIHDTQCGFKVFSRTALDDILPRQRLYHDAREVRSARVTAFDVELLYIARKQGQDIAVIPITWQYGDHSKVNPLTDTIQNVIDVLKVKWNDLRGRY
jgi:glycosyltransferase involved in cell wall biosynthesis